MGYKPNVGKIYLLKPGIVPMVCAEIFERIKGKNDKTYEVSFGMLEIYNEAAQDLLIPLTERPNGGMKIREKSGLGFYA